MTTLLQNEDFKTLAQLTTAGGSISQLLNDTKIYLTALGLNQQLSTAITNGVLVAAYVPGTTQGSVPVNGLPGRTSGVTIPAGFVGEIISSTWSTTTGIANGTAANVASLPLTAGVWQIYSGVFLSPSVANALTYGVTALTLASSTFTGSFLTQNAFNNANGGNNIMSQVVMPLNISANTSVFLNASCNVSSGTWQYLTPSGNGGWLYAVRVA